MRFVKVCDFYVTYSLLHCTYLVSSIVITNAASHHQQDQFDSYRESTIGAAFLTQTISLDENTTVKFEIWDTAGQERYKSLAPMYYRNANCAVVVYDITQSVCADDALSPEAYNLSCSHANVGGVDRLLWIRRKLG